MPEVCELEELMDQREALGARPRLVGRCGGTRHSSLPDQMSLGNGSNARAAKSTNHSGFDAWANQLGLWGEVAVTVLPPAPPPVLWCLACRVSRLGTGGHLSDSHPQPLHWGIGVPTGGTDHREQASPLAMLWSRGKCPAESALQPVPLTVESDAPPLRICGLTRPSHPPAAWRAGSWI